MRHFSRIIAAIILLAVIPEVHADKAKPFIFTPTNGPGPFPVALWLHGYRGYSAEGYFPGETAAAMQKHADILGAVIIGFPATTDLGDNTQQWSEEPVADHAYIQSRLKEIGKTVKLDLSKVTLVWSCALYGAPRTGSRLVLGAQCNCDHHLPQRNCPRSNRALARRKRNPRHCRRLR